ILRELEKPGRDPRPAFKAAVFKEGVEEIKDLKRGMILEGTVTNVAAFGAFVDIGVHQDGLVHISAMSKTFIKDPREVVKPGDIVKVKVLEVEVARKRIALTLRLDDEVGAKGPKLSETKMREYSKASMTSSTPRKAQEQGGAQADAIGQGDMDHASPEKKQRRRGIAGGDDLFARLIGPDRSERGEIGQFLVRQPRQQRLFGKFGRLEEVDRAAVTIDHLVFRPFDGGIEQVVVADVAEAFRPFPDHLPFR